MLIGDVIVWQTLSNGEGEGGEPMLIGDVIVWQTLSNGEGEGENPC